MRLKVNFVKLKTGKPVVFVHERDASRLGINVGDRLKVTFKGNSVIAVGDVVSGFIRKGEVALSQKIFKNFNFKNGAFVSVSLAEVPKSSELILHKDLCKPYSQKDLNRIVKDVVNNSLSEVEIAYFISGVQHCGFSADETLFLTKAIFGSGKRLKWRGKLTADKHCIGGVPGNRTTPIVVAICAAAGVVMPKTSSRAITSASGTADTVETLARVDLSLRELKNVVRGTGGCLAWGGSLGLAPADDKFIRVEKMLRVDPKPNLIASILAKKLAAGSNFVLLDIPYGAGAKVSRSEALSLKKSFLVIAKKLGLNLEVVLTLGNQPVGDGVGPVLEMADIVKVLRGDSDRPKDLERKCLFLSGIILEMVGKAAVGGGSRLAKQILSSGAAFEKFEQIIKAQGGNVKSLKVGRYQKIIRANKSGVVRSIFNPDINYLARLAGCPQSKPAGVFLHKHLGQRVVRGAPLITVFSESKAKLDNAVNYFREHRPVRVS